MRDPVAILVIMGARYSRTPAVLRAMLLALKTGARLLLNRFEYDRSLARAEQHGFDLEAYLKGRAEQLEEFAASLRGEGFAVTTRVTWGYPAVSQIILSVLANQPDYVIKDVDVEQRLHRILFSSLDRQLLRECPAPLMLVRQHAENIPQHIVAAVEPLDEHDRPRGLNDVIINHAAMLAMQFKSQVELIHVFDYLPVLTDTEGATGGLLDTTVFNELRELHREALQKLGKKFGIPAARVHLLDGNPAAVLAEYTRVHHTDLLVLGTTYRQRFERLVMGSTAETLLEQLDCDLLALKPAGFREQLLILLENQTLQAVRNRSSTGGE